MTKAEAQKILKKHGQEHLLRFFDALSEKEQAHLLSEIERLDFSFEKTLAAPEDLSGKGKELRPIFGYDLDKIERDKATLKKVGLELLKKGKVAAVVLAGGQGTRLGADRPKGTFDIGITHSLYIFEQQIRNLLDVVDECKTPVPLYVMTSEKNHEQTIRFFERHDYFSYPKEAVKFFMQEMVPAVDFNGRIFLERKDAPTLSPNGNGGWYSSLQKSGLLDEIKARGIEWLNVYAVDNVLQRIADPVFLGAVAKGGYDCGAKVVKKVNPEERVGVLCLADGKPSIIEYYELPKILAMEREKNGELKYRYGVILNYVFQIKKLDEVAGKKMPVHIVKKKIPYIDDTGRTTAPETENGWKFETLILDLISEMGKVLPFEVDREKEFAPIKNKTGVDSVDSARALLEKNGVEL